MQTMMTIKGQVTVPKPIRDKLGLRPNHPVDWIETADGDVLVRLGGSDTSNRERRRADMRRRLNSVRGTGLLDGETVDQFMASLRPSIPL